MTRRLLLLLVTAGVLAPLLGAEDPPADCNAKVLAYAKSKLGEQVGNGQCSELAREALRDAGARPKFPSGPDKEFAWGELVPSVKEAKPGDLVTFDKVSIRSRRRILGPDGSPRLMIGLQTFPHHVAVVAAVGPKGKTLTILHQNVLQPDGTSDQTVQEAHLVMSQIRKGGTMKFFRPVAR